MLKHNSRTRERLANLLLASSVFLILPCILAFDQSQYIDIVRPSGWFKLQSFWPFGQREMFLAYGERPLKTSQVSIKLPQRTNQDLEIEMVYFIGIGNNTPQPTVNVVDCKIIQHLGNLSLGKFHTKKLTLKHHNCSEKEIYINVHFEKEESLFAWKSIKVKLIEPNNEGNSTTGDPASSEPNSEGTTRPISQSTNPASSESKSEGTTRPISQSTDPASSEPNSEGTTRPISQSTDPASSESKHEGTTRPISQSTDPASSEPKSEGTTRPISRSTDPASSEPKSEGTTGLVSYMECNLVTCNDDVFKINGFEKLGNELTTGLRDKVNSLNHSMMYMSHGQRTLILNIESQRSLSTINVCVDLKITLSRNSSLEILVNDERGVSRSLDTVDELWCSESQASVRESSCLVKHKFCIQDYMPRMFRNESNVQRGEILLRPRNDKTIFIVLSNFTATWSALSPTQRRLRDVVSQKNTLDELNSYWKFNAGSVGFEQQNDYQNIDKSDEKYVKNRILRLEGIKLKPGGTTFDIVSGWISGQMSTERFRLVYRVKKESWLAKVSLSVASAEGCIETIRTQVAEGILKGPDRDIVEIFNEVNRYSSTKSLESTQNKEFRLIITHHLKTSYENPHQEPLKLSIVSLGLSDDCISKNETYCHNGGTCETYNYGSYCSCEPGYQQPRCERYDPCDDLYGKKKGYWHCEVLGASCVKKRGNSTQQDVMRCKWNNDPFFTEVNSTSNDSGTKNPDGGSNSEVSRNSGTIVLLVLFGSVLVLLIIIIIGMIQRLQKANAKLKRCEGEAMEMMQRGLRSPTSSRPRGPVRRDPPLTTISYQNQSFDAAP